MRRFGLLIVLIAAVAVGSILIHQRDKIRTVDDAVEVLQSSFSGFSSVPEDQGLVPVRKRDSKTIRVAAFNLGVLGTTKLDDEAVMASIGKIIRQFDIVAVQEIRSVQPSTMARLMDWVNLDGDNYDYVASHRLGRTSQQEQYAFIFDRTSIEVDRSQSYVVNDPDDLLHREPFVVWCRVRGPEPDAAFTFSLVNVHTDPDEASSELNWLDDVFRQVRDDGRGEDDVIMLGDFNANDRSLGELGQVVGLHAAIQSTPTNTRGTEQYDNLLFSLPSTGEFTGRSGVYDFYNLFDLTMDEAIRISDHLPVWAEFELEEGGGAGFVAQRREPQLR